MKAKSKTPALLAWGLTPGYGRLEGLLSTTTALFPHSSTPLALPLRATTLEDLSFLDPALFPHSSTLLVPSWRRTFLRALLTQSLKKKQKTLFRTFDGQRSNITSLLVKLA